jgi:hypothetical protein
MGFKSVTPSMHVLSEAHPDYEVQNRSSRLGMKVTEAVNLARENVNRTLAEIEKKTGLEDEKLLAKYKIEVLFGPGRTTAGPNPVRLMVWESGKKFHGGGDESMFFCKDGTVENGEGCWSPIPGDQVKGGFAFCSICNRTVNADKLAMSKEGRVTTKALSEELVRMFRQLGSNADIYCKYNRDDIHYISMERHKGRDIAKRLLGLHIFPLRNIIKDTSAGADLGKRFYAFLTS